MDAESKIIRPFLFDLSFDTPEEAVPATEAPEPDEGEAAAPTFTAEQLEAARREGFEEGRRAALAEAGQNVETRITAALETIGATLPGIAERQARAHEKIARQAAELALSVVRKLMPETTRRYGAEEIEAAVDNALRNLFDEPRIRIEVAEELVEDLEKRLGDLGRKQGFEGRLLVRGKAEMGPADCRIVWSDGEIERNVERCRQEIETIVANLPDAADPAEPVAPPSPAAPAMAIATETEPGATEPPASATEPTEPSKTDADGQAMENSVQRTEEPATARDAAEDHQPAIEVPPRPTEGSESVDVAESRNESGAPNGNPQM